MQKVNVEPDNVHVLPQDANAIQMFVETAGLGMILIIKFSSQCSYPISRCGDGTLGGPPQRGDNYGCQNMKLLLRQQQRVMCLMFYFIAIFVSKEGIAEIWFMSF